MKLVLAIFALFATAACTSAPVNEAHWNDKPQRQLSSETDEAPQKPLHHYRHQQYY